MSPVSSSEQTLLYLSMLRIRMIEEAIADRYKEQKMRCPVHLSIGQEAIAVGVCAHLTKEDLVVSSHRAHAHYLAKGGSLKAMIAEIYGKETGCAHGRGGSMHLTDLDAGFLASTPIVGGTIPIGVGAAFAISMKGEKRVMVIFLGEGATEEGVFAESLNFAALKNLPVLFVCENNLYSVYSPMEVRQPVTRDRALLAQAHGLIAFEGDGNDVEKVSLLAKEALSLIRADKGPVYLELSTYRHREHCGPLLDPTRPKEESDFWFADDPLLKNCPEDLSAMKKNIEEEINQAFAFADKSPFPTYDPSIETSYAKTNLLC